MTSVQMKYPGYLLNPGDMFSVDPEMVMLATGLRESKAKQEYAAKHPPPDVYKKIALRFNATPRLNEPKKAKEAVSTEAEESEKANEAVVSISSETQPSSEDVLAEIKASEQVLGINLLRSRLNTLEQYITKYLATPIGKGYVFRTRRKQRLFKIRDLRRQVKEAIKTAEDSSRDSTKQLKTLQSQFKNLRLKSDPVRKHLQHASSDSSSSTHLELLQSWPNARRQDKPYLTPWLPRNWMSAFALIPRYLEVNQNVCSAVYLRHPVARPGLAEVPSPYGNEMGLLAYQWYLRRR
jgi:ribosomal protein S4